MLTALYPSHHTMPSWQMPAQPEDVFHRGLIDRLIRIDTGPIAKSVPLERTQLWPLFVGLDKIQLPVLAHVAAMSFSDDYQAWYIPDHIYIQITTFPTRWNGNGMPIIMEDGDLQVQNLWEDNGHDVCDAIRFTGLTTPSDEEIQAIYWREYFKDRLREAKTTSRARLSQAYTAFTSFRGILQQ